MGEVIAAFTGTGKTYFCSKHTEALDLVCMPFKYENLSLEFEPERCKVDPENIISLDWPFNYIDEIIRQLPQYKYVVIPSDGLVCSLLREEGITYYLCYPDRSLKEEYRKRFLERGNTQNFLDVFIDRWDLFMDHLESDPCGQKVILGQGEHISDYFKI